mgnify:CR=1 FL=1
MKRYLQSACDSYSQEDKGGVFPVSKIDAEIIETIVSIARKLNNRPFTDVISKWKEDDDRVIVEELRALDEGLTESQQEGGHTTNFVSIGDLILKVDTLASIEPVDDYDTTKNMVVYKLILNRDERSKIVFANAEVGFLSARARDEELERLRNTLEEFANVRFL